VGRACEDGSVEEYKHCSFGETFSAWPPMLPLAACCLLPLAAAGRWPLAAGCWLLAAGCWLLAAAAATASACASPLLPAKRQLYQQLRIAPAVSLTPPPAANLSDLEQYDEVVKLSNGKFKDLFV
jgi:hypothetical protein